MIYVQQVSERVSLPEMTVQVSFLVTRPEDFEAVYRVLHEAATAEPDRWDVGVVPSSGRQQTTRSSSVIEQPTAEQCTANAAMSDGGRALWLPQMGGYSAKSVAYVESDGCVNLYVWHDGHFPFDGECPSCGTERQPVELHLCDPGQFTRFGRLLQQWSAE